MRKFNDFHKTELVQRTQALGRLPAGRMNGTEALYAEVLEAQREAGYVLWWCFESVKFRLADNTFYTPDFMVLLGDLTLQVHEVKGHWEDDARAKIKIAADLYPVFKFIAIKKVSKKLGTWEREEF